MNVKKIQAVRYHDISTGHRVVGHEGKCRHLHGHNYRIHFYCEAGDLDDVGRVIDFSYIKSTVCEWLEKFWDHKFLAWTEDPLMQFLTNCVRNDQARVADGGKFGLGQDVDNYFESIVWLPFNPTAENLAQYLVEHVCPNELKGTGVVVTKVVIEETSKCSVTVEV